MAIPVILKGDTAREIKLVMAEGYDYGGCTLIAQLGVAIRTFAGLAPGDKVAIEYAADETATFPLGTSRLHLSLRNVRGEVRTLPWAKVKVTDSPGEVYGAEITIDPGELDVADLTAADSLGAVKTKLQAVIDFLRAAGRGAALSLVVSLSLAAGAAVEPKYAPLNDLPGDTAILTNAAEYTRSYTDEAIADLPPPAETDPHFREWVGGVTNEQGVISAAESAMFAYTLGGPAAEVSYAAEDITAATNDLWTGLNTLSSDVDLYVEDHRVDIERVERRIDETESSGNQLAQQVAAIGAYLNGEDARFVVTNYDSVVHTPEAYVEIKVSNDWLRVWDEGTRWNKYETWKTNVDEELSFKADRAWGVYDSETGGYSPAGFTQVSSSNILIASGMAYQRTVTSAGSVWVLQCNQGVAQVSGDTNGFFRVMDADGVTQFEIIKGDKREIGADADSINIVSGVTPTKLTIGYSVVSQTHPTLQICQRLESPEWKDETDADCIATVTWSGQSGAYVATVQGKENWPSMFIKASYEIGGETYIRNNAPVEMPYMYIGKTKYYTGTAVINGHTVLTLSTTAP